MPRPSSYDFLHSMRFHVVVVGGDSQLLGVPEAGFSAVTTPELTIEMVDYREGQYTYTRKLPGIPSYTEITMSRGVMVKDTSFWKWIRKAVEGGDYRVDLQILHFHRAAMEEGKVNMDVPGRTYEVYDAVPMRHKVAADLDATSSEVSIMELDVAFERLDIHEGTPEPKAVSPTLLAPPRGFGRI